MKILTVCTALLCAGIPVYLNSKALPREKGSQEVLQTGTSKIFVDGSSGSDSNPGTKEHPLKTISAAAELAIARSQHNIPATVTINPGTYRESIQLSGTNPNSGAPITFQALKPGTVTISGSDLWTAWQSDPANPQRYFHSWPYRWGQCSPPQGWPAMQEIARRREMIFVNNHLLTQVLSVREMSEGTFFIDEVDARAYIWPSGAQDIAASSVEVAVRPLLFFTQNVYRLTLKGLVFEHANSCVSSRFRSAVAISGGANPLIEDSTFIWNNEMGLGVYSAANTVVRGVVADYNGELGINGYRLKDATFENVETSYNNWRGDWGHFYTEEPSGGKFLRVHGGVFRNYKAVANQGRGLWFDTDNLNITIDQAHLARNRLNGIFIEKNLGPILLEKSRICENGVEGVLTNSQSVSLVENLIFNNGRSQIYVVGRGGSATDRDWETGEVFQAIPNMMSIMRNTIIGTDSSQLLVEMSHPTADGSHLFFSTLHSDDNIWYNSTNRKAFQLDPGGPGHHFQNVDISQWQSTTGQDKSSTFGPLSFDAASLCAAP